MALEKQDLLEWNSHPVTKAIFKEIDNQILLLNEESVIKESADLTAMQAARNEGMKDGARLLKEAYEELLGGEE